MPTITTQIDIAATPAEVRKAFLDFGSYPTWAKTHFVAIQVTSGDRDDIKQGEKLKISMNIISFPSEVKTNTPEEFIWYGSLIGLFTGEHCFKFQSTGTPGHTTFIQGEEFTGLLSFLVGPTWGEGKKTKAGFEGFNAELKARVEGSQS